MLRKDVQTGSWVGRDTADAGEIARFNALAEEWWNPDGRFRTVHAFNDARRDYIISKLQTLLSARRKGAGALSGLSIIDIGCAAGLLAEPLAAAGAAVTGIDASARNIQVAQHHAGISGLDIAYRQAVPEELAADGERFDAVLAMEVIEHVPNPRVFLDVCCQLIAPGGVILISTINRTLRSLVLAKFTAEYVLRFLPVGTHDWRHFVKPQEIASGFTTHGLGVAEVKGLTFSPLTWGWRVSDDTSANYMVIGK